MSQTDVVVRDNPDESRHEILVGGEVIGFSSYALQDGRLTLPHAEVAPEHGGRGLASRLVTEQLDEAAGRGLEVVPVCPFVRKVVADAPDTYLPLVPEDERDRLDLAPGAG